MLGKTFGIMMLLSVISAAFTGNMKELSLELVSSMSKSVELCIGLLGMMCFWSGYMNVLKETGVLNRVKKMLDPLMNIVYGKGRLSQESREYVSASVSANLLGLGNAALPLGINAVKSMQKGKDEVASDETIMFAVLNTVPFQLVPSTLIALRTNHGSVNPFDVILPIWACSVIITVSAVIVCKLFSSFSRKGRGKT